MVFDEAGDVFEHLRGLAEEDAHFHVDGVVLKVGVFEHELSVVGGFADDGEGAALAFAEGLEGVDAVGHDAHDVALLGFVAPDLHGGHGGVFVVDVAQVEASAGGFDELGQAVGETAGADVVDGEHGVVPAEGDAAVDDLLAAAFHLGVAALDGVKVEGFGLGAGTDGGGCAAAETDLHGGSAELDDEGCGRDVLLGDVFALEVAHAAGGHDGLVVAAVLAVVLELEGAEHAAELWAAEFIAKGGAADRTFEHDVHRGGHALRVLGDLLFPGLGVAGHFEVGDHEGGETCLGAAADTGGTFVADFTADAGGCAGEGRDRGRVVVGLDLAEDVELGGGLLIREAAVLLVDFPPVAGERLRARRSCRSRRRARRRD